MANGPEVARGYVTIIPSMQGAQATISKEMGAAAVPAGKEAGQKSGAAIVQRLGTSLTKVGQTMTKYITVPTIAAATASVAAWKDVDASYDTIVRKTGATGEQLENLKGIANDIGKTIPSSFADIGTAVGEVNTRFGVTGDQLQELSTDFLKFADINKVDVNTAIDGVSDVIHAFGMETEDTAAILDVFNVVGQQTGIDMNTLASSMSTNAAAIQEMGLSAAQGAQLLGQFEMAGMDTSAAMMGMKTALKNAADEGKSLGDAMKEWQEYMNGTASDTDKLTASIDLFGSRAGAQFYNAAKNGKISLEDLSTSLSDFSGSVDQTYEDTKSPLEMLGTSFNEIKLALSDLVEDNQPLIEDLTESLVEAIHSLSEWLQTLSPEDVQNMTKGIAALAALGPILTAIGTTITTVASVVTTLQSLSSAISALGAGEGILATISASLGSVGTGIAGLAASIGPWIAGALAGAGVGGLVGKWFDNNVIGPMLEWAGAGEDTISEYMNFHWFGEGGFFSELFGNYDGIDDWAHTWNQAIQMMMDDMVATIAEGIGYMKDDISEGWNNITTTISTVTDGIKQTVSNVWNNITSTISNVTNGIKTTVSSVWNAIVNFTTTAWTGLVSKVTSIAQGLWTGVTNVFNKIKTTVSSAVATLKSAFNFSWSLPHIKLPHFSVSGKLSLDPPSIPKFSVSWYEKAATQGALFSSPSIIGVGDAAQAEMLIGESTLYDNIAKAVAAAGGGDITIPVYIGQKKIETIVIDSINRYNYKSGGR